MAIHHRRYQSSDFMNIRDFLVKNYCAFKYPVNWFLTRWNYARYLCAPMMGAWGVGADPVPDPDTTGAGSAKAIALWESVIGVWETDTGEIAGVVCPDEYVPWHPAFGQAFLQRTPEYDGQILPEMLAYAEDVLAHNGRVRIYVGEHDYALMDVARQRGFVRDENPCIQYMKYDLSQLPAPDLPNGYRFLSAAENCDTEKRRKIFGLSFRHPNPRDWPVALAFESLYTAPDYHPELDLVVVRPDGKYVACTIGWIDTENRLATVEPLGSIQLGMGREVLMEALRRMRDMGAVTAHMDAGLKYYRSVGFVPQFDMYRWVKTA